MMWKEVSEKEFEELKHGLELKQCPICNAGGGIIQVSLPWYGPVGARVVCTQAKCSATTKWYGITDVFFCGAKIANPSNESSMMRGIMNAVDDWNGKK